MVRGPGGNEPYLILQGVKNGLSFDESVREVERIGGFTCERWWIDLNRKPITEAALADKAADPKPKK